MSDTIKGLTAKIGADTADFLKEMKKVDKEISSTNKTASELQKGLELKYDSSRLVQAQKTAQQAIELTNAKVSALKAQLSELENSGNVDTESYRKLQTELAKAETQALKAETSLEDINNTKFTAILKNVKQLGTELTVALGPVVALAAGIYKLCSSTIEAGDEISTLSAQYDMSTKAIQQWQYVAMQSDVSSESLFKGVKKVKSALADLAAGETSTATEAIEELGVQINTLDGAEVNFEKIITALSNVEDATMQTYYANEIFGENLATNIIPLLQKGTEQIDTYISEFEQAGYLTDEEVESLSEMDNMLNEIKYEFKQIVYEVGNALMPIIETVVDYVQKYVVPIIQGLADFLSWVQPVLEWILNAISTVCNWIMTLFGYGWLWGKKSSSDSSSATASSLTTSATSSYVFPTSSSYTTNTSSDTYNNDTYNITVESNEYVSTDDLVDVLTKKLAIKVQSRS